MSAGTTAAKPYKGMGMEGAVAKWYAKLTGKGLAAFEALAQRIAGEVPPRSAVLEVAPGPGYFAIELAKLGNYQITGLDISKTFVEIVVQTPRDRNATFEPQILKKHQTRFDGFDEKILSMYARGMSTREIQGHLEEMYGVR